MSRSNVTTAVGFIDLSTFDCVDGYLYGGPCSVTYFVRSVKKANWFSFVPISLRHTGNLTFDGEFSATLNRSGDYILNLWLRVRLARLTLNTAGSWIGTVPDEFNLVGIRWCHNFMHNLVEHVTLTFNELTSEEFSSAWFDFNNYFRTPGSKKVGYDTMIGEVAAMTVFVYPLDAAGEYLDPPVFLGTGGAFDLPLPFWFTEDSGIALPIAGLPFNDVRVNYKFRSFRDLMVVDLGGQAISRDDVLNNVITESGDPVIIRDIETYAHYAVVHNDERCLMGTCPRDIVFTQVQNVHERPFVPCDTETMVDLRLSHPVMFIAFAARNTTIMGEYSNYAVFDAERESDPINLNGFDPISRAVIHYEGATRVDMGADYYSLIVPWYWCPAIPDVSGIHGYSYALRAFGLDPSGSTNHSKLSGVQLTVYPSDAAIDDNSIEDECGTGPAIGTLVPEGARTYKLIVMARNWNVHSIKGGSIGLPVL